MKEFNKTDAITDHIRSKYSYTSQDMYEGFSRKNAKYGHYMSWKSNTGKLIIIETSNKYIIIQ